ncbi:MAG: hypothetical protein AB1442_07745 [Nitrospirota bacterium]
MNPIPEVLDRNGNKVHIGSMVKVLSIPEWLLKNQSEEDAHRLNKMVGQVFEIYEIDEYGGAWVQMWFEGTNSEKISHSLSLDREEMELSE